MPTQKMHFLPLAVIVLDLVIGTWTITAGTGSLLRPSIEGHDQFFDAQGEAILAGRLDVPCSKIGNEAYIIKDRCYGYFVMHRNAYHALPPIVRVMTWGPSGYS
jgi:hypothetical protein